MTYTDGYLRLWVGSDTARGHIDPYIIITGGYTADFENGTPCACIYIIILTGYTRIHYTEHDILIILIRVNAHPYYSENHFTVYFEIIYR